MASRTEEIARAFGGVVEHYDRYMEGTGHAEAQRKIAEFMARNNTGRVLDVATGTGIMLEPFRGGVGVDVSPSMIKEARRKNGGKEFVVADAHHLPFKDKAFDTAISCLVLPWLDDSEGVLREMQRVAERVYLIEEEGKPARKRIEVPPHLRGFFEKIERLERPVPIKDLDRRYRRVAEAGIDGSHKFVCWMVKRG